MTSLGLIKIKPSFDKTLNDKKSLITHKNLARAVKLAISEPVELS